MASRWIASTSATSAMPKPCATREAMPFSSGDSHMKFGDTSCFLKKLLVNLPRPECLAKPSTGKSAKSVASMVSLSVSGWPGGSMETIYRLIIGTKSIPFSSGEYEPKIMSYLPFFNPSIFTEVMS